jgi:hypothetical protein
VLVAKIAFAESSRVAVASPRSRDVVQSIGPSTTLVKELRRQAGNRECSRIVGNFSKGIRSLIPMQELNKMLPIKTMLYSICWEDLCRREKGNQSSTQGDKHHPCPMFAD